MLQLRGLCVEVLALCGTSLGYKNGLKTIILQDLNYLEHLAEFNADILAKMSLQHGDASLLDAVLQHLGSLSLSSDDTGVAKIVSSFLLKLTVTDTRDVLRNIVSIADFMDGDLYALRMTMLEIFAILYGHLMLQDERSDASKAQARSFLSAIEERLRDVNAFVRSKVLHVLGELVIANALPVVERARLIDLVVGRVMDKSSNVRRRAIQLLGEFLRRHPFCVDGGELSLQFFKDRLADIEGQLEQLAPAEIKAELTGSMEALDAETTAEETTADVVAKDQAMQNLLLQKRYYSDAVIFVKQLDAVVPTLCRLLASHTKTEVFEVMDFFVDASVYRLQSSELGVRKMMHLIWEQDLSTEDGTKKSIREHVLASYRRVYLDIDSRSSGKERILAMAQNLLGLVKKASAGDLASLEQIVTGMVKKDWISDGVIQAIAHSFVAKGATEQRSALILLTMIGSSRPEVVASRIEAILKIGLGSAGRADPWVAEYTCLALRLVAGSDERNNIRLPNDNIVFAKLIALIKTVTVTPRWLQVTAQAIKTLYLLSDQPSLLATVLLKELSREVVESVDGHVKISALARLLFLAGHVAAAEVSHLDAVELHWKQTKASAAKINAKSDSMEGVTATEEEDIVDAVRFMRESELLYGQESLLAAFGPIIAAICADNIKYADPLLQNVAAMTLAKFMAVSGQFCDAHLPLFLTILERSPDALVRSNLTIAFADLAQAFGRIVDTNIIYLFRRLKDPDVIVKRNALLVLTHLTLTGLIKVKGQVGEIAKCILDDDPRVADIARLFFHELAGKDNAVYNHIPDIISTLSLSTGEDALTEEEFKTIARFIFEYIKKERQMEGLVEKLCQRFRQCANIRQARDLACCLTLVNYGGERTARRLIEALPLYKDKLVDRTVYNYIADAMQKARKGTKAELRAMLDEFEQRLIVAAGEGDIPTQSMDVADELGQLDISQKKGTKGRRSNRRKATGFDDDADPESSDDHITRASPRKVGQRPRRVARLTMPTGYDDNGNDNGDNDNDEDDIF